MYCELRCYARDLTFSARGVKPVAGIVTMPISVSYTFNEQVKLLQIGAKLARRKRADQADGLKAELN